MIPPSTLNDWPVMFLAASDARKTARRAMSSGVFDRSRRDGDLVLEPYAVMPPMRYVN
jgi:hypothetical protein